MSEELVKDCAELIREMYKKGADVGALLEIERSICGMLNVEYDEEIHDVLFCSYYVDAITTEQLIAGISE